MTTHLAPLVVLLQMDVEFGQHVDSFFVRIGREQAVGSYQSLDGLVCLLAVMVQLNVSGREVRGGGGEGVGTSAQQAIPHTLAISLEHST